MTRPARYLLIDDRGRVLADGPRPALIDHLPPTIPIPTGAPRVAVPGSDIIAVLAPPTALDAHPTLPVRELAGANPALIRAAALLHHRARYRFDPRDGSPLTFDEDGIVARGRTGEEIYPRIDPCVIGAITLADTGRLLLAENARRPGRFTVVAGYVEAGESLEDAFAREAFEETGRRVSAVQYWGSQPWPTSGSLMMGFTAVTDDEHPVGPLDGELRDIRWVAPDEVADLPLPPPGSIARRLIEAFVTGRLAFPHPTAGNPQA